MKAYLSRRYRFSASHRLNSDSYSAEQNLAVFGKCNNPHGHGHNYIVEVTFGGQVDPVTGMVCDLGALDTFAHQHLTSIFDLVNLNTLDHFKTMVPSTENLAIVVHRIFSDFTGATLTNVHVEETGNNSFDYPGEIGPTTASTAAA
ncbi:6-carboxytetrahydropterin synthase [Granulicella arctica]|uniref:6-carboxytetrahydropterin synthase n=1 Tax=Granulicella arctica TaxID=940613 RepID=UPI0021DFCBCD|nr:6-carboxytetrahydropterin synthase [Granulicella arctica]